jgi:D-aspartate ligase
MSQRPAILIGGSATAMPVARRLTRAGIAVHAIGGRYDPLRYSRCRASFVDVGYGPGFQERALERLLAGPRTGVIMPASDDAVDIVARNRAALTRLGYVAYEGNDRMTLAALDKAETYRLAAQIGLPTPSHLRLASEADLARAGALLSFPCCLKPVRSHDFMKSASFSGKVVFVESEERLRQVVQRALAEGIELMAIEVIPGADDQILSYSTYMGVEGKPLFDFVDRKLRQGPIHFGTATYRVSDWDPEAVELGAKFCTELGVRGTATVEFKRDARDDGLKLIECNNRLDGCLELMCRAGVDLPVLTYERSVGRRGMPVPTPARGLRLWHPADDVSSLRRYRRTGELTLRRWLRSLMHKQHFPVFSWRDPLPTVVYHVRWFAGALRNRLPRSPAR